MPRRLFLLLALATSSSADRGVGDRNATTSDTVVAGDTGGAGGNDPGASRSGAPRLTGLTGLYEGGPAAAANQLCIIEEKDEARFGIVLWRGNAHSCSGSGTVVRHAERLSFFMSGDSNCRIDATVSGTTIAFPDHVPAGCAYYCGARARLDSVSLTLSGAGRNAALSARDLVGDPLCLEN